MLFEETLKFLVYLTITKPCMNKAEKSMELKGFVIEFETLVQLKDYLKDQIKGNKG
jgi:hypothetical protein